MKKLTFKILIKLFDKQIKEHFLEEQVPTYKIDTNNNKIMEKIADLWRSPEFKIWLKMQSNRKNHLGKEALNIKYKSKSEGAVKNSYLQGQAYNISLEKNFIRYLHNRFEKQKDKKDK